MPPTWNKVSDSTDALFIRYKLQFECAVTIALITCRSSLLAFLRCLTQTFGQCKCE